jgi:TetR/AcrR family transcriptional regulator, cholesterol catabolism regulator
MADRRDEIVKEAARLFARRGFEATSIREIAAAVNILSGSLYHHFATKEEILLEAVIPAITQLRDRTVRIATTDAGPEVQLTAFVLLELGEQIQNYHAHAVLYNERKLFRGREEFERIRIAKRDIYEVWREAIRKGTEQNLFDATLDPYHTIRTIIRMLNSAADWLASGDETLAGMVKQYSLEQVQGFYVRFILGAIRAPKRAAEPIPLNEAMRLLETCTAEDLTVLA